jgi:hypothetical protein
VPELAAVVVTDRGYPNGSTHRSEFGRDFSDLTRCCRAWRLRVSTCTLSRISYVPPMSAGKTFVLRVGSVTPSVAHCRCVACVRLSRFMTGDSSVVRGHERRHADSAADRIRRPSLRKLLPLVY